ncbi:hypothetical protein D9547_15320, partial [Geobacillus stearothermophilus]
FLQWFGLDTFTIQENSHFLYPLFSLCTPIFNDQVQLVVKSQIFRSPQGCSPFFSSFCSCLR